MFYYLYQITNNINGKIYIGIHKTKNLDDGYMGSGSYLSNAYKTYGKENFSKTILSFFDSDEELLLAESDIVNENFLDREDVYNLVRGGIRRGYDHINERGLNFYGKNGQAGYGLENLYNRENGKKLKDTLVQRGVWETYCDKISCSLLKLYENGFKNPFKGKTHTQETKNKIGSKNSIHQSGQGNSQFGKMWITNGVESKKIKKTDSIPDGWRKGRIILRR